MSIRSIFAIAVSLALGGCCLGSGCYVQLPANSPIAWDGLGTPPTRHSVKRAKARKIVEAVAASDDSPSEKDLAKLRPYSKEWGAALDAMNEAADAKLKKKLIICRNCMPAESDDQTGSIATNRH
jgi:hypothetical protein